MTSLVHLVADYDEGDPAFAEVVQRLALVAPGAKVQLMPVGPCDTIAAGLCVAWLALTDGPADRLIIHDVVAATDGGAARASDPRLCAGRSAYGALVLGHNGGWTWSFARGELHGPCYLDVCPVDCEGRAHDVLHFAVRHLLAGHPHAVCESVPSSDIPAAPERAIAYVDARGNLTTTIPEPPASPGERLRIRVGRACAEAVVAAGLRDAPVGELALIPARCEWRTRKGGRRRFTALVVRDGSAARWLDDPRTGTPVELASA